MKITHPFHPQYNQEFQILKIRKCAGKLTLSLRGTDCGSFGIQADWTDYFLSEPPPLSGPGEFISLKALSALCDMVKKTDQ
ncbi:MAG: hypothetical protein JJU34_21630 [Lunatimonas sp.]|uniref:DUF5372 family protein n=1 Tax=Lunatimonas sp. TaxID=2060141 RepID=UPI002A4C8BEC|nr:hypothetical protein [Lunatimonas sp.]